MYGNLRSSEINEIFITSDRARKLEKCGQHSGFRLPPESYSVAAASAVDQHMWLIEYLSPPHESGPQFLANHKAAGLIRPDEAQKYIFRSLQRKISAENISEGYPFRDCIPPRRKTLGSSAADLIFPTRIIFIEIKLYFSKG